MNKFQTVVYMPRNVDRINIYLADIRKSEILSDEQMNTLVQQFQTSGSRASRDRVVRSLLPYAVSVANKFQMPRIPISDLVQQANLSLILAVEKFDTTQGTSLIDYATTCMINDLKDYCKHYRTPLTIRDDKEEDEPYEMMICSVDAPMDKWRNDKHTIAEVIASDDSVDDMITRIDSRTIAHKILAQLSEDEQRVLCWTFGIGCRQLKDEDIAQLMDLSEDGVYRLRQHAINHIMTFTHKPINV